MAAHDETPGNEGQNALDALQDIRQSIDNIDAALIHLLAERFKFTQQVGRLKAVHGLPPADPERELLQIQRLRGLAEDSRLDPAFAEKFLNFIIAEVIHHHEQIAGADSGPRHPAAGASDPHRMPLGDEVVAEADAPSGNSEAPDVRQADARGARDTAFGGTAAGAAGDTAAGGSAWPNLAR